MKTGAPKLDHRNADDIYRLLLSYAKNVDTLSSWRSSWDFGGLTSYFNAKDEGLVLYKIAAKMSEELLARMNETPQKYQLAFYDLLGLELRPAASSVAPVTFYPAKGIESARVPRGAGITSKTCPGAVFETLDELYVYPVEISNSISYNPWSDSMEFHYDLSSEKHQKGGHKIFLFGHRGTSMSSNMPHRFYLSFGEKLKFDLPVEVEVALKIMGDYGDGQNLPLFSGWSGGSKDSLREISSVVSGTGSAADPYLQKSVLRFEKNSFALAGDAPGYWICCEPRDNVQLINFATLQNLPSLADARLSVHVRDVFPDYVFVNRAETDFKKGFYPFEKIPKERNAFYIGSENIFSRKGASITVTFQALNGKTFTGDVEGVSLDLTPQLLWQYWNGSEWKELVITSSVTPFHLVNGAEAETKYTVSFISPADMTPVALEGKLSTWIRVVLAKGSYELIHTKVVGDTTVRHSTYHPPFIRDMKLEYQYSDIAPDKIIIENYDQFQEVNVPSAGSPVLPYVIDPQEKPAFYIAFEGVRPGMPVSVFSLCVTKLFGADEVIIRDAFASGGEARMQWQYFDGNGWVELKSIIDGTQQLDNEGIFSFSAPHNWQKSEVFQLQRHWIRLQTLPGGSFFHERSIYGLFPNTVYAEAGITMQDETIGSGNGKPDLTLSVSRFPILPGEKLCVMENTVPSQEEMKEIEAQEGDDAVLVMTDEAAGDRQVKVRWHAVKNFYTSGPRSRHYVIDRTNGTITFGDGEKGFIPPVGKRNIFLEWYKTAGLKKSNLPAMTIDSLKSAIPGIGKVINYSQAAGGRDPQNNEDLMISGAQRIRNRNRVVTVEDYEAMAKEASPDVAKAFCPGYVQNGDQTGFIIPVLIIPQSDEPSPVPSAALAATVENFIKKNAPAGVGRIIEVKQPLYVPVAVSLEYKPVDFMTAPRVSEEIERQIIRFFHPLYGKGGAGWLPGESVRVFEMGRAVEDVEGVDYISSLSIHHAGGYAAARSASFAAGDDTELPLAQNELPCAAADEIIITLKAGG